MKDTLAGIVSMLEGGSPEQQVAAAQVLAWLKPKAPAVVKPLAAIAQGEDSFLKPFAVEALGAIGNAASLAALIPLLHFEGPLRDKVVRVLSQLGSASEKVLIREFSKADHDTKGVILEILTGTRGAEAMRLIMTVLKDPEAGDLASQAAVFLRQAIVGLRAEGEESEAQLAKLRKSFTASLRAVPKRSPTSYRVHLLQFLAEIPEPSLRQVFLTHAGAKQDPEVRAASLRGLVGMSLTPAQGQKLLGFLLEDDFVNIVGPALEVVVGFEPTGASTAATLGKLLQSPRPEVRLYAIRALRSFPSATSAAQLLPFLTSLDSQVHEAASRSLGNNPEAREGLLKMLFAARDLAEVNRPIEALVLLAPKLSVAQLKKVAQRFVKHLESGDPLQDAFQRILAGADEAVVGAILLDEAKKQRSKGNLRAAMLILQTLSQAGAGSMTGDARYELGLVTMLQRQGLPTPGAGDPVIGHFCNLLADDYKLLAKLKRERSLSLDDLLYLGQRFVERVNEERRFGSELLAWLIQKEPEAKTSVQALQKLKVEGLA